MATAIGQQWGWRAAFAVVAVLGLSTVLAVRFAVPPLPGGRADRLSGELRAFRHGQLRLTLTICVVGFGEMFAVYTYITGTLTDVSGIYWFTSSGGSSARFYWENFPPENSALVHVPTAVTIFPRDIERLPRSWVERRYRDLRVWSEADRGGHFPMLEVPDRYVAELRSAFAAMLT